MASARKTRTRRKAFVLVLTLFLTVLLASTGAAIAVSASIESVLAAGVATDLEHDLAVDSFFAVLPKLQSRAGNKTSTTPGGPTPLLRFTYGRVRVRARIQPGGNRVGVTGAERGTVNAAQLRSVAREHGLLEENIQTRPIVPSAARKDFGAFAWFDQIIAQMEFEEVFRWRFSDVAAANATPKKTWSDLLTFWGDDAVFLEIETTVGEETARWFIVARGDGGALRTIVRERV